MFIGLIINSTASSGNLVVWWRGRLSTKSNIAGPEKTANETVPDSPFRHLWLCCLGLDKQTAKPPVERLFMSVPTGWVGLTA